MLFFTILSFSACKPKIGNRDDNPRVADRKVAKVFDREITLSELSPFIVRDSAIMVSDYINKIIQEEVIAKKAAEQGYPMEEIEARTQQFRKSLIMIEFQREYFKHNVDTNVTENELKTYYDQNSRFFHLSEDIFKGYYIKLPENTPKTEKLKELMSSNKTADFEELKSFCLRYANLFILNNNNWAEFPKHPEIIKNFNSQSLTQYIRTKQVIKYQKEDHLYLVRLFDYKQANQTSPFEYCKNEIRMLVLNKRKMHVWSKFTEQLLNEAKSNNNVEIYP